ncbi:Helix-turn-helix type 3 domain protein [Candidatus Magnetomorum sp. HK-1]|nr:Helix-turn-helix type 3 domain protein [Candidatus Magnetomorum sp. HK-1]
MILQERIQLIQKKLGLTQSEFAKKLKTPQGTVSDWYNRGVTPRTDKLQFLVEEYSVNPDFLLRGQGKIFFNEKKFWSKKEDKRLREKYKQLLTLINYRSSPYLIKLFYDSLLITNWKKNLDQKLGKAIFGSIRSVSMRLNMSPNIMLIEVFSNIMFDIMKNLSTGDSLRIDQLYILSEVCDYDSDDFQKFIPGNQFSNLNKKELYSKLDNYSKLKYKMYGLKDFSKDSKTSNTAWQGIRLAFKQLDDIFRYNDLPNLCKNKGHNYFYWFECPVCKKQTEINIDNELPKATYHYNKKLILDDLVNDVYDILKTNEISLNEFTKKLKKRIL